MEECKVDVASGIIVKGLSVIRTHLNQWLDVIGQDTKLKDLDRTDCANYFYDRTKTKKSIPISQTTVENEQRTINAMMKWLHKRGETYIDSFDFKKLKRIDKGADENRLSFQIQPWSGRLTRIRWQGGMTGRSDEGVMERPVSFNFRSAGHQSGRLSCSRSDPRSMSWSVPCSRRRSVPRSTG